MLPADDRGDIHPRYHPLEFSPLKIVPFTEDNEGAFESRGRDAARPASFAARVSAARWSVVAGACLLVAAACLLLGRMDAAFVAATLGVVAWFWNERNRLQPRGIETDDKFQDEHEYLEHRDEK